LPSGGVTLLPKRATLYRGHNSGTNVALQLFAPLDNRRFVTNRAESLQLLLTPSLRGLSRMDGSLLASFPIGCFLARQVFKPSRPALVRKSSGIHNLPCPFPLAFPSHTHMRVLSSKRGPDLDFKGRMLMGRQPMLKEHQRNDHGPYQPPC